jgi:hypothetical protein
MNRVLILIILLLLAGCAPLQPAPPRPTEPPQVQPTQPLEPDAEPPVEAGPEASPTPALLPTLVGADPQTAPSETDQPANSTVIPGTAEIAILRPGQFSRHTSPMRILASVSNPDDTRVAITLYGEDSRVLAQRVYDVLPYQDPLNGNVILEMEFQIEGLAETGRLELKTYDAYGRLQALNSVNLILLSVGITDRNYAAEDSERIQLQIPFPGQTEIEGGQLFLSGLVRLTPPPDDGSPKPLTVQLIDEQGQVVGEGRASVVLTAGSSYGQFVAEIPYQVEAPTNVLLTIGIEEGRLPGFTYIKTFPYVLLP